jgi:uncharacterized linocin/CFP29 family protein
MQTEMRYMVGQDPGGMIQSKSPLGDLVMRALGMSRGRWDAAALRRPGFQMMAQHEDEERTLFRAAGPLPDRAQIALDNTVVQVGMQRLTFAADIMAMGLVYNLTDPLSVTQLEWNAVNKVANAQRSMTPSARTENFLPGLLANRLPVYLTLSGFELDIRTLRMSQRLGLPLDTAGIASATRAVNEYVEDAAINGATTLDGQQMFVAGYSAPGLLNAPNANTANLTAAAWDTTPVPATILAETMLGLAQLRAAKKFGPYIMYVNTDIGAVLDNDYVTASPQNTIRERLLKLEGLTAIKTADMIPGGTVGTYVGAKVAIVQMTSDVVDMVVGQQPTVIPWTSADGFTFHNLVMAILIPRFRSDYNGASGVWIGTLV